MVTLNGLVPSLVPLGQRTAAQRHSKGSARSLEERPAALPAWSPASPCTARASRPSPGSPRRNEHAPEPALRAQHLSLTLTAVVAAKGLSAVFLQVQAPSSGRERDFCSLSREREALSHSLAPPPRLSCLA